jgi:hypothetical protein
MHTVAGTQEERVRHKKPQKNTGAVSIFTKLKRLIHERRRLNMPEAKPITSPMPYTSSDDFCRVFDEDMSSLYLLSYLLTADHDKAEQCFVSGLEDVVDGSPVFREWARSWARRVIIVNAVRAISPQPMESGRSSTASVSAKGKMSVGDQAEIAAVLALEPFERFVYVVTVLERFSDQDCSILLGCARRDVVAARTRAFEQIGGAMASNPGSHRLPAQKDPYRISAASPCLSC